MPDYKKGKVYEIVCRITCEKYIGSTIESLSRRLANHRCLRDNMCRSRQIIERGDYYINLLEECPCENKEQLLKKEREWYDKSGGCVNRVRPYITEEEVKQRYRVASKKYVANNKDKIKKKRGEKITCECGKVVAKGTIATHNKTEIHKLRLLANKNIPVL